MEIGGEFRQFLSKSKDVRVQISSGEVCVSTHLSYGCDGVKEEGVGQGYAGYRVHYEAAARAFIENAIGEYKLLGIEPSTHVLVWRIIPELGCFGNYEKRYMAYARFCFVRMPEGATLLDCDEI